MDERFWSMRLTRSSVVVGEIDVVGYLPPARFSQPVSLVEGFITLPALRLNSIPPRRYMFVHNVWHLFHFKCLGNHFAELMFLEAVCALTFEMIYLVGLM